jgi:large subunit ribosomal protein L17
MRHGVSGKKFGRNQTLRAATIRDLVKAVLINQRIQTTRVKAGEARKAVDKMITLGKKNTLAAKRRAFAILCDHALVSLFLRR